jgi:hypothetical protein
MGRGSKMSGIKKYDLQGRYEELLKKKFLILSEQERSSFYQFVHRNGGKISSEYGDNGYFTTLIQEMKKKDKKVEITVDQLLEILKRSNGKIGVRISISVEQK